MLQGPCLVAMSDSHVPSNPNPIFLRSILILHSCLLVGLQSENENKVMQAHMAD